MVCLANIHEAFILDDDQLTTLQVFGLADIYLNEVLVTRDQTLYDLKMMTQFRCINQILVKMILKTKQKLCKMQHYAKIKSTFLVYIILHIA